MWQQWYVLVMISFSACIYVINILLADTGSKRFQHFVSLCFSLFLFYALYSAGFFNGFGH